MSAGRLPAAWRALAGAAIAGMVSSQPPRPQDDLFLAVNETWLQTTPIPDDRVSYSASAELVDRVEAQLHALLESLRATSPPRGSERQQMVDLYRSVTDQAAVARQGLAPIADDLRRLREIAGGKAAAAAAGRLSAAGEGGPFEVTLVAAARRADRTIARVAAGGLLMPDWSYYLSASPAVLDVRRAFAAYLTRLFVASGQDQATAESAAGAVIAFETAMADALRRHAAGPASPRIWSLSEMERDLPGFLWREWAAPQGLHLAGGLMLDYPEFFKAFAAQAGRSPPGTLSVWLQARLLTALAPYLPEPFSQARFDFFGTRLTGQVAPRDLWKRGVSMVSELLGDALGRAYVAEHFSPDARAQVTRMVESIIQAAGVVVGRAGWVDDERRSTLRTRLDSLGAQVGYPDEWRSYAGLTIRPDDLLGNVRRLRAFDTQYRMSRARMPRASRQWLTSAQTVNAYYSAAQHEIAVPAGILQAPYFEAGGDAATNYGAIGAVIGHEVSHALDLRGLAGQAAVLHAQLAATEVLPGLRVNADLTLPETLADVVGLQLAHLAFRRSAAVVDVEAADRRFLMSWARIWRAQARPDFLRYTNETSPHPPAHVRANVAVTHLEAFVSAFAVQPRDRLYRPAAERLRIW